MHRMIRRLLSFVFLAVISVCHLVAQTEPAGFHGYQQAPQPIHDILNAAPTPLVLVSPKADYLLVADRLQYPPIADLAQPMLRLAGLRINPVTNGRHHPPRVVGLSLVDVATGKTRKVSGLPANAYLSAPEWSPDGTQFAFTNATGNGTELWIGNAAEAKASPYEGIKINAVMGEPVQWMPDGHTLLVYGVVIRAVLAGAFWRALMFYSVSLFLLLLWTPRIPANNRYALNGEHRFSKC